MEIPTDIKYEFFFLFMGLFLMGFPVWLYIFYPDKISAQIIIYLWPTAIVGLIVFAYGLKELVNNYLLSQKILKRELIIKQYAYDQQIRRFPARYKEPIKNEGSLKKMIKSIKLKFSQWCSS